MKMLHYFLIALSPMVGINNFYFQSLTYLFGGELAQGLESQVFSHSPLFPLSTEIVFASFK